MNPYVKLALFATSVVAYEFGKALMAPYQQINRIIAKEPELWLKSKEHQSVTDKFVASKISGPQYIAMMDTGPARLLWAQLTTQFPHHRAYIFRRLRETYPNSYNFTV